MEVENNVHKSDENMAGKKKTRRKENKNAHENVEKHPEETGAVSSPETARSESGSPEPNCAICLGKLQNKSFTDSCFHMFCFTCLLEWSKVKAVCPLCKQAFKSIIHNVRSNQDYDQYHLRPEETGSPDGGRFRYRTTLTTDRWMFRQQMETQRQLRMLQRPTAQTARSQWRRMRQAATSTFRQRVYNQNMWVGDLSHPPNRPPRYRNISVAFFKRNPAATHRLVPWLNRELNVVLHNREDHVQFVLELIMDLIKRFEIQSEEFLEHIRSFMGPRSEHFVHEFFSFVRSPFDMVAYDSHAIYDEPEPHVHSIESDSSSDNDDVILVSPNSLNNEDSAEPSFVNPEPPNAQSRTAELSPLLNRVRDFLAFIDTSQPGGWDSPLPGPSSLLWSPGTAPFSEIVGERGQPSSSQGQFDSTSRRTVVELSPSNEQSDEDDVMIVAVEKAWDRRTPIQLSSDEETTSPEKHSSQSTSPSKGKHHKSREQRERMKSASRKKRSRSKSRERHCSCPRSRSTEQHHRPWHDKRPQRNYSPDDRTPSTSQSRPKHYRFSSNSPSRKRSRRSLSSSNSCRSSVRRRSHSSEHHHQSRSSRSPHKRRRDRSPSPRFRSSSPEYCGSYRHERGRYHNEDSTYIHKKFNNSKVRKYRSKSRESSVDSRTESRRRHRHHSSSSIETIYEKSHGREKHHKSRKHKKRKKHKKHKSKDKEKKLSDRDSSSGVEIVEISEDESKSSDQGDSHRWKKHPTGHKKSSKSKSDGHGSDAANSTNAGHISDGANSAETLSSSSSNYNHSKWKPVGAVEDNQESEDQTESGRDEESDKKEKYERTNKSSKKEMLRESAAIDANLSSDDRLSRTKPRLMGIQPASSGTQSVDTAEMAQCDNDKSNVEPNGGCGTQEISEKRKLLENLDGNQESLHEIEKTLRANILNRLSNSKLHTDASSAS